MSDEVEKALHTFARMLPESKVKVYEHQPNDDRRLMEVAYLSHLKGESLEAYSFISALKDEKQEIPNGIIEECGKSVYQVFLKYRSMLHTLDSIGHLKK